MQKLITMTEATKILDVTLSTVSYYVRTGKLPGVECKKRTAHRQYHKLVSLEDVERLKAKHDAK